MHVLTLLVLATLSGVDPVPQAAPQAQPAASSSSPQPRDQRQAPSASTGVIRGRVVSADTGEALRHARVSLSASELKDARNTATDGDGRFEFRGLPVGRFLVLASKTGYVTLAYGERRAFQGARRVDLASGQVADDVSIALPRGAVIAGTVVNDVGEPVTDLRVSAFRLRYRSGRREVAVAGQYGRTNDLGQFRISRLPPGTYFVGTAGGLASGTMVIEEGVTLAPTFHPSTANMTESRTVSVRGPQELRGIDIAMVASRASSVAGTILDSRGQPAQGAMVTVRPGGDSLLAVLNTVYTTAQASGQFKVSGLLPGEYALHAVVRGAASKDQESADVMLSVSGDDIEGLNATAAPNGRITGRVLFDGDATPTFAPPTLRVSAEKVVTLQQSSAQVGPNWEFELRNIEPGRQTLTVDPMPAGWAIKRVVADGRDVTESFAVTMVAGGGPAAVEITLTDKPTKISGAVAQPGRNAPPEDFTVVVFGDDPAQWREGSRRVVVAKPERNGTYELTGLPSGRYRAIAIDSLDDGEQWNPEFLGWARSRGRLVDLKDASVVTVNLELTKYTN